MATTQIARPDHTSDTKPAAAGNSGKTRSQEGDDTAVAAFILGLVGLFFFNIVLGPLALVLGGVSFARGTKRRFRAALGMLLGVADLVVLAVLMAGSHGGFTWRPGI
jgi:hypothetical protein